LDGAEERAAQYQRRYNVSNSQTSSSKMQIRVVRFLAAVVLLNACSNAAAVNPGGGVPPCTFKNPIAAGQDPWVVREGQSYYLAESSDNGIWVYKSSSLTSLKQNGVKIWSAPTTGWNRTNIWAPELHLIDGTWYVYYAGGTSCPPFITQHAGVLRSTGGPQGPYDDVGMLYTGDDLQNQTGNVWAIDLTVGKINGQLYAIWSGWTQNASTDRTAQNLYIARMSDGATISSNRVLLATPTAAWERDTALDLEEGPELLEHAGQEFIVYSTHASWLPDYELGQLRLVSPTADPMDPANWTKSNGPVFKGTGSVYGVGHASFTTSPDGTQDWIVYHSKVDPSPGWNRDIRTQQFSWNADGSPNFGTPVAAGQSITLPSGACSN
jgi:GH43 family beta-xylosidase